jgi:hypothetical protein
MLGAVTFGVFQLALLLARRFDDSDTVVTVLGATLGYLFLVGVVVLVIIDRRTDRPERAVLRTLRDDGALADLVGRPVRLGRPRASDPREGESTVELDASGPRARGRVVARAVRRGPREWAVAGAEIDVGGVRARVGGTA